MAYIQISEIRFLTTADLIDGYLDFMNRKMNEADEMIRSLDTFAGKDAMEFQHQWSGLRAKGSAYQELAEALENYASYLRYVDRKYSDAQTEARTRANTLLRY